MEEEMINGYALCSEWHDVAEGRWAKVKNGSNYYFLKEYKKVNKPPESVVGSILDRNTYDRMVENFNAFVAYRRKINTEIKRVSGSGGNIVVPLNDFVYGQYFVEVSDFYDDMISGEAIVALSAEDKDTLMKTLTKTLMTIHRFKLVHGDLKAENVVCVKNKLNRYVCKLIDFGASYFETDKFSEPSDFSGDQVYASPELSLVWRCEEEEEDPTECIEKLSVKSDIFSLGLVFHYYLTGKMPLCHLEGCDEEEVEQHVTYAMDIVSNGGTLSVRPEITDERYAAVITACLERDPEKRPSAQEVLTYLNFTTELWEGDAYRFRIDALIRDGYTSVRKSRAGRGAYEMIRLAGRSETLPGEKLVEKGYVTVAEGSAPAVRRTADTAATPAAPVTPAPVTPAPAATEIAFHADEPWPEHHLIWNEDAIVAAGYKQLTRKVGFMRAQNYELTDSTGNATQFSRRNVLERGFAQSTEEGDDGWDDTDKVLRAEDKAQYTVNTGYMRSKNIRIRQSRSPGGLLGYDINMNGRIMFKAINMLFLLGIVSKK